ncbi:L-lactate dehydrogenase [Erysipelothrix urinaevulpis]|uniref:L-lactate dehydrogenase n=1 Tax=Erysipelothrix urinaevulpis TaxID=2683717 RepID=UPI0013589815|nr:L-lactate dehydrogenase [Erysipelothrix urinaevulpis]
MSKISIIGAGAVGAATAFALSQESWINEITLIDINEQKAKGEALDIMHGIPLSHSINVSSGDYSQSNDSDVVIITVGVPEVVGESRLIPLQKNTAILESIIPQILAYSPNTTLLVVSNPVDLLTYITYQVSGLPKERVIGLGTMLDTSRLRYLLSRDFKVSAENISSQVVGEHGDSQVVLWSKTSIAGLSIQDYAKLNNIQLASDYFTNLEDEVRQTAFDVWEMKGPNAYCVATAISKVTKAIIRNENLILPVSSLTKTDDGEDIYISLPTLINRSGAQTHLNIPMNNDESKKLNHSKTMLKELANQIKFGGQ